MVVVGTKPEYLNAVWVKNEWSRYLALMRTDRSRLLIPCYRDMDPYDMPEELSMLQSQDMGKIGFIQDLIRGVKKVVDAAKPQETAAETVKETVVVHNEGGSNVQALLKRGKNPAAPVEQPSSEVLVPATWRWRTASGQKPMSSSSRFSIRTRSVARRIWENS
jgi:hypothetical protein